MTAGSENTPGLLWRLDVKDRDGNSLKGYPKIFVSDREYVIRLGHLMTKNYEKNLGYTFIKSGCTRSPWMNLDGPILPEGELYEEVSNILTFHARWKEDDCAIALPEAA